MSALPVLLFLFGGIMKLVNPPGLAQEFTRLGIPEKFAAGLGILEIACTMIYAIPRTAVLGAILLTGYLGGAILTHLRIGEPFFMPVIIGIVIWGGIYLRDPRLRELIPFRRMPAHARESEVKSMGEPLTPSPLRTHDRPQIESSL